jgi:hypothetical protein
VLNAEAEGFVDEFTDSAETLERKLGRKLTNQENDALWDSFPNEVEGDIDVEGPSRGSTARRRASKGGIRCRSTPPRAARATWASA